jgi:hypothetical protein
MPFQPYPIADVASGFVDAKEPWLLPADAFVRLDNASLYRNRIQKRPATELLAYLRDIVTAEGLGTIGASTLAFGNAPTLGPQVGITDPANGDLIGDGTRIPIVTDATNFKIYAPTYTWSLSGTAPVIAGTNIWRIDASPSAGLNYSYVDLDTGEWVIFRTSFWPTGAVTCDYSHRSNRPTTLIHEYVAVANGGLCASDTQKFYELNLTTGLFDIVGSWPSTLTSDQFVHVSSIEQSIGGNRRLVMVAGPNGPREWDGTSWTAITFDAGAGLRAVEAARMVFYIAGHVVYLRPTLSGAEKPQMAVWTSQSDYNNLPISHEAVASTDEAIQSAGMLKNDLFVFFDRSLWKLRYTGQPGNAAFEWLHVSGGQNQKGDSLGSSATLSTVMLPDRLLTMGAFGVTQTNGDSVSQALGGVIRLPDKIDLDNIERAYGVVYDQQGEAWFAFPSVQATDGQADTTLALNLATGAASFYEWPFRCFGLWRRTATAVQNWDDAFAGLTWDEVDVAPDAFGLEAGWPVMLGGDSYGGVYRIPALVGDASGEVAFDIETKRINPFMERSAYVEADLGWIDLFSQAVPSGTLRVRIYRDYESAPYYDRTVPLDPQGSNEKVWRRVNVFKAARHHRIRLTYTGTSRFAIDAIVPWIQAGGQLEYSA